MKKYLFGMLVSCLFVASIHAQMPRLTQTVSDGGRVVSYHYVGQSELFRTITINVEVSPSQVALRYDDGTQAGFAIDYLSDDNLNSVARLGQGKKFWGLVAQYGLYQVLGSKPSRDFMVFTYDFVEGQGFRRVYPSNTIAQQVFMYTDGKFSMPYGVLVSGKPDNRYMVVPESIQKSGDK